MEFSVVTRHSCSIHRPHWHQAVFWVVEDDHVGQGWGDAANLAMGA